MRHKQLSVLLVLLGTQLMMSCTKTQDASAKEKVIKQMEWLYSAKPDRDFQSAVERKDFRYMGLYSYSLYVPGVDPSCVSSKNDIKPIEGTSDVVLGYEHAKLIAIAGEYARDFNTRMLFYREEKMGSKCLITLRSSGTAQRRVAPYLHVEPVEKHPSS